MVSTRKFYHGTDSINMEEIRKRGGLCVPRMLGEICDRNDPACDSDAIYVTTDFREAVSFARMATRDENDASIVFEILESDLPRGTTIEPDDYIGGPEKNAYRLKGALCVVPNRFTVLRKESSRSSEQHLWKKFSSQYLRPLRFGNRRPVRVRRHWRHR